MKKTSLIWGMLVCCLIAFTALSFKAEPGKKTAKVKPAAKSIKTFANNMTFTANGSSASYYYRIQFAGPNFNQIFPFNSSAYVPNGTYTVAIFPASNNGGASPSFSFSGQICANNYSGSGQTITYYNVLVCGTGYFIIN